MVVGVLFMGACATSMTPEASKIKVSTKDEIKGFEYLGIVEGSSSMTGVARDTGFRSALNEAMNKAAKLGATNIVLDEKSEAKYWSTSENVRAEAYRK